MTTGYSKILIIIIWLLLLLLSHFSHVWLFVTPSMVAHQAPPSLGFSRQEHWSALPFPSPMHESEKWKWSRSVASDSLQPHGLQHARSPILHHLPKFAQTHVHWVSDAIQPSHPLLSITPLPSIFSSIAVFSNESVIHIRWPALVLPMNIQDWFPLWSTGLV